MSGRRARLAAGSRQGTARDTRHSRRATASTKIAIKGKRHCSMLGIASNGRCCGCDYEGDVAVA